MPTGQCANCQADLNKACFPGLRANGIVRCFVCYHKFIESQITAKRTSALLRLITAVLAVASVPMFFLSGLVFATLVLMTLISLLSFEFKQGLLYCLWILAGITCIAAIRALTGLMETKLGIISRSHPLFFPELLTASPNDKIESIDPNRRDISRKEWLEIIRPAVLDRDNHKCILCSNSGKLEIHHIYPKSKGGSNTLENLITLCRSCHINQKLFGHERLQFVSDLIKLGRANAMKEPWSPHPLGLTENKINRIFDVIENNGVILLVSSWVLIAILMALYG